jgi:hypothetical protein
MPQHVSPSTRPSCRHYTSFKPTSFLSVNDMMQTIHYLITIMFFSLSMHACGKLLVNLMIVLHDANVN